MVELGPDPLPNCRLRREVTVLRLAIVFLVIALVAAFFGFGGVAAYSWDGARILFFIFLVLAILSFFGGWRRRPPL